MKPALNVKAGDGGYDQELALRMNGLILTTPNDRIPCEACNCTGWKHWIDEKGVIRNAQHYSEL